MLIWFFFKAAEKEKKLLDMYVHYMTGHCNYSLCILCSEYEHTWATGVWLVRIGPSCPQAHRRLILSLPSAGWNVYRRLYSLLIGALWLRCPYLGAWLRIFSCTYVHMSLWNRLSCTHGRMGSTHAYESNHTNHTIGEDWSDLLFLSPSVGYTYSTCSTISTHWKKDIMKCTQAENLSNSC